MIQKNRSFRSLFLVALVCGTSAVSLLAQGPGGPPPGGPGGPGGHRGPQPNRLFDALDTNHDGVISADEMANATASLKSLLKEGATSLTREDLRPARPGASNADAQATPEAKGMRPHHPPTDNQTAADGANAKADGPAGQGHHGPPPSPLFDALDTNHDGTISADEMNGASASLKTLLKNGATQLKREDLRPPRPPQPQEN